ncbi:ribosome recycling factor [Parathielavia hyrcaniae]|uniref:Ribosome recycling factor n=1 Tax=Parathielavia hyrcaniae TaxID=113614 RepID=A0AAN6QDV8_9PEZI|nr:ribosome recycling factor [Parathielavia hyrcaniae]
MKRLRVASSVVRNNATTGKLLRTPSSLLQNPSTFQSRPALFLFAASTNTTPWQPPILVRPFCHAPQRQKRKDKDRRGKDNYDGNPNHQVNSAADTAQPQSSTIKAADDADAPNPFDFSDLQAAFDQAAGRFADDLKKLRAGGRFNADTIGAIRVQPDRKSAQTFPLRELATVAPLGGRRWSVLAFDEASVKAIVSAVQRSDEFNQQPQRSDENPLELTMTVEPERADALVRRAREVCQAWRTRVREEAHRRAEMHKKWRAERLVSSDDVYKLRDKLQKLQDERMNAILAKEKEVVAGMMARGA